MSHVLTSMVMAVLLAQLCHANCLFDYHKRLMQNCAHEIYIVSRHYSEAVLLKVLALYWTNLERVSADAHTPRQFSIFINSADSPWLSIVSVSSVCIGIEHRSSVQNIIVHSKNKRRTLLVWYADDEGSFTLEVPLISDVDLVSKQTAFHNCGSICLIKSSKSNSSYSKGA